jgi:hypothetical protein
LTLSLPSEVGSRLRADAKAAGAPSLSAYVVARLGYAGSEYTYRNLLDEMFRSAPMTDEEREWADAVLDQ